MCQYFVFALLGCVLRVLQTRPQVLLVLSPVTHNPRTSYQHVQQLVQEEETVVDRKGHQPRGGSTTGTSGATATATATGGGGRGTSLS